MLASNRFTCWPQEANTARLRRGITHPRLDLSVLASSIGAHNGSSNGKPSGNSFSNANFPTTPEGRTYHLGTKRGEVANRILSVGSTQRAELLSKLLEPMSPGRPLFRHLSSRGFLTVSGLFNGVPVSIISTHMGMPNMDFVVRESRAVVDGQMAIVRLGTCGALQPPARLGSLVISQSAVNIKRNPDAWASAGAGVPPYLFTLPVAADPDLVALLAGQAGPLLGHENVVQGLNATADSFYSSQGRTGGDFDDRNVDLIDLLRARFPSMVSLEMETFHLLDLARCSRGGVKAAGMCLAVAERASNAWLDHETLEQLELKSGIVAFSALCKLALEAQWAPGKDVPNMNGNMVMAGQPLALSSFFDDWNSSLGSGSD